MSEKGERISENGLPKPPKSHMSRLLEAEKKSLRGQVARVLHMPAFDHTMGAVIMANMLVIIMETDHGATADDVLPWAEAVGWVILTIFIIELAMRLYVLQSSFFVDYWNTFDMIIVVTDSLFSFAGLIFGSVFPMSILRIFRLCKLARVSKVFRVFPELRLMMAGLIGSIRAIFWGTVLLAFVLFVWAIIAVQFIHPLNKELTDQHAEHGCERCPRAYDSVLQATLTFSQQIVAGDSWGQATIPVIEAYPMTAIYFLGVFLSVGMAVMNLILGVVVNVAQSEHDRLKGEMQHDENVLKMEASHNLLTICEEMDMDKNGEITKEELIQCYRDREDFRAAVAELQLTEEDMGVAFAGMDEDKNGTVSYNEFIKKIYKMKESDSAFLMEQVKYNILQVKDFILTQLNKQQAGLEAFEKSEKTILAKICQEEEAIIQKIEQEEEAVMEKLDISNDAKASATPTDRSEKEVKLTLSEEAGARDGTAKRKWQTTAEDCQTDKVVLAALSNVSRQLEGELKDTLLQIKASLELHARNTSSMLSELVPQRPGEDISKVHRNLSSGFAPAPVSCCRV